MGFGNKLVGVLSIFVPIIIDRVLIPLFYHPSLYDTPLWTAPYGIILSFFSVIMKLLSIWLIGIYGGLLETTDKCNKRSYSNSMLMALIYVVAYIFGNILLYFMPFAKIIPLFLFSSFPYSNYIVHGAVLSIVIMTFGVIENSLLIGDVC